MPAMKTKPLDTYIGFNEYTYEQSGKLWVALKPNLEGNYAYKENTFTIRATAFTGIIENSKSWLVCTLSPTEIDNEGSFSINVRNKSDDGKWLPDKQKNDELKQQWLKDGCLAAIEVSSIPTLKILVKVLNELKIICKNELLVRVDATEEQCSGIESALSKFLSYVITNGKPKSDDPIMADFKQCRDAGLAILPYVTANELPTVPVKDDFGDIVGSEVQCFPFIGELPFYESLTFEPPKITERKKSGNSWGSSSVDVDVAGFLLPSDRLAFIINCLKNAEVELESEDFKGLAKAVLKTSSPQNLFELALKLTAN